jgi:hypothetical protein
MTPQPSIDELLAIEARLDRSFVVCIVALLAELAWPVYLRVTQQAEVGWGGVVYVALALLLVGAYIWFALSVGKAAKAVGNQGGLFLAWTLCAALLSFLPIPIVSTLIAASPLSLKFLLSGQLRSAIHDRTFEQE